MDSTCPDGRELDVSSAIAQIETKAPAREKARWYWWVSLVASPRGDRGASFGHWGCKSPFPGERGGCTPPGWPPLPLPPAIPPWPCPPPPAGQQPGGRQGGPGGRPQPSLTPATSAPLPPVLECSLPSPSVQGLGSCRSAFLPSPPLPSPPVHASRWRPFRDPAAPPRPTLLPTPSQHPS